MQPEVPKSNALRLFFQDLEVKTVVAELHKRILRVSQDLAQAAEAVPDDDWFGTREKLETLLKDAHRVEEGELHPAYSEAIEWALTKKLISVKGHDAIGVDQALNVLLAEKMGDMPPITGHELASSFREFLRIPADSFEDGYALLSAAALRSCELQTTTLCDAPAFVRSLDEQWPTVPLQLENDHFEMSVYVNDDSQAAGFLCTLELSGRASDSAFRAAAQRLRPIGQTILRNLQALAP